MESYTIEIDTKKAQRDIEQLTDSFEKLADVIDRINRGLRVMNELNKKKEIVLLTTNKA